jgi:WD40 repeat protein
MEPWTRATPVQLPVTSLPSLLFNNLASSKNLLCYAHDSQVTLLDDTGSSTRTIQAKTKVLSACLVAADLLIVCAAGSVEVWRAPSPVKARLLWRHALGDYASDDATQPFCRGAAHVDGSIYVGCSSGDLLTFDMQGDDCSFRCAMKAHRGPVSCLASSPLVSACDRGEIRLWRADGKQMRSLVIEDGTRAATKGGDPCSCLAVTDIVIAGFASGRVRSYSLQGEVLCDLQAHARCLTALSVWGNRLATVGEDAHLFVWALPSLELVHASHVTDALLTGVAFLSEKSLACGAYDAGVITVLERGGGG